MLLAASQKNANLRQEGKLKLPLKWERMEFLKLFLPRIAHNITKKQFSMESFIDYCLQKIIFFADFTQKALIVCQNKYKIVIKIGTKFIVQKFSSLLQDIFILK